MAAKLPLLVAKTKSGGARAFLFVDPPVPWEQMEAALRDCARRLDLVLVKAGGKTEIPSGTLWMPYRGHGEQSGYGVNHRGMTLDVREFVVLAEKCRLSPDALAALVAKPEPAATGQSPNMRSGGWRATSRSYPRWTTARAAMPT